MSAEPLAYRILSRAAGAVVGPGDRITAALDRAVLSGARVPATLLRVRDRGRPWNPDHLLMAMDFQAPEVESQGPRSRALCRELAETYGLRHVFDLNRGIGSHVVLESAQVPPGYLVAGCGRCLGVMGGIGVLPLRLDEDALARAIVEGRVSLEVPPAVRVDMTGRLPRYAGPLDLASAVAEVLGPRLRGHVVEIHGDPLPGGVDLRVALCGLLAEMGAFAALVATDDTLIRFYRERGVDIAESVPPPDGGFEATVELDAGAVVSVFGSDYAGPFRPLAAAGDDPVHGVFAGSCYGGRYDDLSLVAEVLKKRGRVAPGVRLIISPASLETAQACLAAGFYETFLSAGAMVVVPGGGPGSAGGGAIFGDGERIASTAEYHRHLDPGQGSPEVHLLGPAAAAVAATEGRLQDPAEFLA
jgi:3-isopropylmalate/(R)-2-methylmalate dehydratase large subunit